jgi:hypothetical protein
MEKCKLEIEIYLNQLQQKQRKGKKKKRGKRESRRQSGSYWDEMGIMVGGR